MFNLIGIFLKNNIYGRITPRIALFFISVPFKLVAIALVSIGIQHSHMLFIIFGLISWIVWFILIFTMAFNNIDEALIRHLKYLKRTTAFILAGLFFLLIIEVLLLSGFYFNFMNRIMPDFNNTIEEVFIFNDSAALSHQALDNFVNGENPYKTSNIVEAFEKYDVPFEKITPIKTGRLLDAFPYPDKQSLKQIWEIACQTPGSIPNEIMSKFNYPAGSIIISAPFYFSGIRDMRIVGILLCVPILIYAVCISKNIWRVILLVILLLSIDLWSSFFNGGTGYFIFPFLLLAWLLWKKNWLLSALSMGLAIAMKQIAWFYLIFYLILIFRVKGFYNSLRSCAIIFLVFLSINIPFIIDSPSVWINSVFAPVTESLFPMGVGIISFISSGIINIQSSLPFTIMEVIVLACCAIWYYFNCKRHPYTGPLLSIIPFFFAWRSLPAYFLYADIIIIVSIILNDYASKCLDSSKFAIISHR
jgi:hypothetical protein